MYSKDFVPVNKYYKRIREISILKRITVDYPLLCRDEVAKKLAIVAESLPEDLFLQVDSAYRDSSIEQILFDARNSLMPGLVKDPKEGHSSHYTGGTVDVSLCDKAGKEINLSAPFTKYYEESKLLSNKISKESQRLRNILHNAMLRAGFSPIPDEYWHFSYGNKAWAEYYKKSPIYDYIDIDKKYFYPFYLRILYKILKRLWKVYIKVFKIEVNY